MATKSSIMTNRKSTTRLFIPKERTSFPTSYRWSAYVTPKSSKGSKSEFSFFWNKSQLQSNKSATKFLYVKSFSHIVVV